MATTKLAAVSPRQLEDALNDAQTACIAYTQPEEVQPGLSLCAAGRVMRAMHMAKDLPKDKWEMAQAAISQLEAAANVRLNRWINAERHYRELCDAAGVEPYAITPGATCGCEGCKLVQEGIDAIQRLPLLPKEQWASFRAISDAQTAYAKVAPYFEAALGIDHENKLYVLCAPPMAKAG